MLDRLLKPKFYRRCKTCLDCTKSRIETIRKKRKAVQKFLKNDIADLLRSGLHYNAYGRAEGFLIEQNLSFCYELVVKFIGCISDHLQVLSKERNCPDECKEAVQSLIYAAARFADLPELRDLRTFFKEKFGDSLEPYISIEFVEKLKLEPTKEMKIQILHDISQEFSIKWNSKAIEERLNRSSPSLQEKPRHKSLNMKYISGEDSRRLQSSSDDEASTDISSQDGPKTCSSSLEDEVEYYKRPSHNRIVPPPSLNPKPESKESSHDLPEPVVQEKPKPRSVRTRGLKKPPSGHANTVSDGDSRDEEERIMDGLLMHYSQKKFPYESKGQNTIRHTKSNSDGQLTRGTSLPSQLSTSVGPEMASEPRKHVHPKLPDYDDLTARLAAVKGR